MCSYFIMEDLLNPDINSKPYMDIYVNSLTTNDLSIINNVDISGTLTVGGLIKAPSIQLNNGSILSNYVSGGTFLPNLQFGGASTGITYASRFGFYTRIGNVCYISLGLTLSNKGSSTGAASITGLPFPPLLTTVNTTILSTYWGGILFLSNYSQITGLIGVNSINIGQISTFQSNPPVIIDNNGFDNSTLIKMTGFYFI